MAKTTTVRSCYRCPLREHRPKLCKHPDCDADMAFKARLCVEICEYEDILRNDEYIPTLCPLRVKPLLISKIE